MFDRPDVSLGSRRSTRGAVLVDHACRSCAACSAGAGLWCTAPVPEGRQLTPELPESRVAVVAEALLSIAALEEVATSSAVLLLSAPASPVAVLGSAFAKRLVVATSPAEARAELKDEATGRAAVVVAGADARIAVRGVRRGGHVCVADPTATLPSVTELVQREVTLVGPRDVAGLAKRIDLDLWTAVIEA